MATQYPCDQFVAESAWQAWRGVTVDTPPECVWPWVVQIRLAPYSYDWIDNLGRQSPRDLRGLPEPVVGDPFSTSAGRPVGRIVAVEPGVHLTATILGCFVSYLLVPQGDSTRLLMKLTARKARRYGPLIVLGDLVMARRQLLNLKRLAETAG
jgi:hypothetical protein